MDNIITKVIGVIIKEKDTGKKKRGGLERNNKNIIGLLVLKIYTLNIAFHKI